jgi:hypothetical protein
VNNPFHYGYGLITSCFQEGACRREYADDMSIALSGD